MRNRSNHSADSKKKFCCALLFLLTLSLGACSSPPATNAPNSEFPAQLDAPRTTYVPPNAVNTSLASKLDHLIDSSDLASARWGVSVVSLKDNRVVYERNADKLFTPASNMKLFPTAVALELLGADYRWRTSVYATATQDASGTINGDLVLYGRGAPDLVASGDKQENNNSLDRLAANLFNSGVQHIAGNVIGDESYFRGESLGDGWQWNDIQWYFGAEASALSINNNETSVNVLPPEKSATAPVIRVGDRSGYVTIENKMIAGTAGGKMTVGIQRGLSDNVVRIWGTFPPGSKGFGARLSVYNPARWAAMLFLEALKAHGIRVDGSAQTRNAHEPISRRFDPNSAQEIAFVSSKPLREIIKETNKQSINLYAELILRTVGRERGALLSAPEPGGRERGDDETGLAVIKLWLNRSQVTATGLALHDGSGLSRLNLVSPRSLSELLASMKKGSNGQIFQESLPVSGRDGTLGSRLQAYADRVSAKTGYLTYDTGLSGYVTTAEGEVFAFSIICNDETGRASSNRLIDQMVSLLVAYPARSPEKSH
jgi:D-alanyl-D-alanine carboxypeptidase/D-alanyl-D-alanine-endopeptidase (penicillin-binding protein 4)